jgi:hypothetical protein
MKNNFEFCLFLTATIRPNSGIPGLKRTDPKQRENDYAQALQGWIKFNIPIVFCENSDTKSEAVHKILSQSQNSFEYLHFKSTQSHLGKGHGEHEIFSYAFKNSYILNDSRNIIKVTGRYSIRNFHSLFIGFKDRDAFIHANLSRSLTWADSRFFCFKRSFWEEILQNFGREIDESKEVTFENILAKSVLCAIVQGNKWSSTRNMPWFAGVYGTENIKYKQSYLNFLAKTILFQIKKRLMHDLPF